VVGGCSATARLYQTVDHKKFGDAGMWQMIERSVSAATELDCLELLG
jgi:hypothetical protein